MIHIGILTVSDGCARGEREDRSGALIDVWCTEKGHEAAAREVVPDETTDIVRRLVSWCDDLGLDVIVTPSLEFESFGRPLVEAMAFSKPAVASKVGGMVELIDDGVDGFLVDKNDPEALAERICRLLGSEATRKEMGKAGHAKYLRSFTADAMARKYHELFN